MAITTLGHAVIKLGNPQNNRSTDNTIRGIQNEGLGDLSKSGYAIAEGTETTPVGTLDAGVLIPIHNRQPVVATSAEAQTGKVKQSSIIKKGGALVGDGSAYVDLSAPVLDNVSKWAVSVDLSEIDIDAVTYGLIFGNSTNNTNFLCIRYTTTRQVTLRTPAGYYYFTNYDTTNFTAGKLEIISDGAKCYLYVDDELKDNITVNATVSFSRLFDLGITANRGIIGKISDIKSWNLSSYDTAAINKALVDSLNPDHRYNLTESEGDTILDSGANETKINGTVINGNPAQWGTSDLSVSTLQEGFATIDADNVLYPALVDGSGYAGLTGTEPGFTAYSTNSFGASEHNYILPDTYECIALDEASGTAYWTDGAGTVIEVDLSTIPENDADFKFTDISNDPVKINHIMRYTAAVEPELSKIKLKLNIT